MSGAIAAALKKVAVYIGTDKKALKTICGIVLGIVLLLMMPIIAILGIFTGTVEIDTERLMELIEEQQKKGETILMEIEEEMRLSGCTEEQIEEAQVLYALALFPYEEDENFIEKLSGCFKREQTEEELIYEVNQAFGTTIKPEEFKEIMQEYRDIGMR